MIERLAPLMLVAFLVIPEAREAAAGENQDGFLSVHREFMELFDPDPSIARAGYLYQPSNETSEGSDRFDLQVVSAEAWIPLTVSRDLILTPGLRYQARIYDFSPETSEELGAGSETLHAIVADGAAGYFVLPELLLLGDANAGIYSDFDQELVSDDVLVFGSLLAVYGFTSNLQVLVGVAVSEDFENLEVMPLAGFRWGLFERKLHLSATLPLEVRAAYDLTPKLQVYAGGWLGGDQYHGRLGGTDLRVQLRDQRAGVGLAVRPIEAIQVNVEGGASIGGQFEFELPGREQLKGDLESTWYLSTRLGLCL